MARTVIISSSDPPTHVGYEVIFSGGITGTDGFGPADQVVSNTRATGGITSGTDAIAGEGTITVSDDGTSYVPLRVTIEPSGEVIEVPPGGSKTINGSGSSDGTQEGSTSNGTGSSSGSGTSGGSSGGESSPSGGLGQTIVLPSGTQGEGGMDTLALVGLGLVVVALLYAALEGF